MRLQSPGAALSTFPCNERGCAISGGGGRRAAASAHSRGLAPLSTPPSASSPCLSFGPGGLAAGLATSTRNPCHGRLTKHRLSPRSCGASALRFRAWGSPPSAGRSPHSIRRHGPASLWLGMSPARDHHRILSRWGHGHGDAVPCEGSEGPSPHGSTEPGEDPLRAGRTATPQPCASPPDTGPAFLLN